jgi:VWFA-related protein
MASNPLEQVRFVESLTPVDAGGTLARADGTRAPTVGVAPQRHSSYLDGNDFGGDWMRLRPAAVLLGLGLALLGGVAAPESTPQAPVFGTDVSLVLLPVFVVDREGKAVRGLHAEDFSILEDGDSAEVVSFRYVDTTSDEAQEELRRASGARRRFLLLFDKSFTDVGGLFRAQRAASDFVRQRLAESDLAAVATFDVNHGLRLVANFTEDRALLVHAVESLGVPGLSYISDPLGLAADLMATDIPTTGSRSADTPQQLLDSALGVLARQIRTAEEQQYRAHIQGLLGNLTELARALRHVDGRKQILYFSAGFDQRLLVGQEGYEQRTASQSIVDGRIWEVDGNTRFGDSRLRDVLHDMTRNLSAADAVMHTIDVTGMGSDESLTRMVPRADGSRSVGGREALNYLAEETGGRFFKDTNDLTPVLQQMLEMTSRYYVLGFQPREAKGPGTFHKVRVKVERKNAKISHRPGYYERAPAQRNAPLQRQFEAAQLVMTGAGDDDLRFASLCLPFPAPGDRQTLGLVIQVPRESLPWKAGTSTALEFYAYAVGEDGAVKDHLAQLAQVDPGKADPDGHARGISLYGTLHVPPGSYTLRLVVRERDSGQAGAQFVDVTVPPYDPRAGVLLPPLLMDDFGSWLSLEMGRSRSEANAFPFQMEGQPFLPRADFTVRGGELARMVLIAYEPEQRGDPASDVQIWSSLRDREGTQLAPGLLKIDRVDTGDNGRRTYLLGYTPASGLAVGDYTLRVGLGEAGQLLESYSLIRVRPPS